MIPPDLTGAIMASYKGGRNECHIRREIVPVVYADINATYPTLGALLNLWPCVVAQSYTVEDVTAETQALLEWITLDDLFDPTRWPSFVVLCRIYPAGEVIPEKAQYAQDGDYGIALNPTWAAPGVGRWLMLPDLIESVLLTGRVSRIERAIRVIPQGVQKDLRPVSLRDGIVLDPYEDVFQTLLRVRHRVKAQLKDAEQSGDADRRRRLARFNSFLKIFENSFCYGLFAQYTETDRGAREADVWTGEGHFVSRLRDFRSGRRIAREESPGRLFHPWIASSITSAARLILAMMERMIRDRGGTWAEMDTDSALIVASERGGLVPCPGGTHRMPGGRRAVRALSREEVQEILSRFDSLSPVGQPFWKIEDENRPDSGATRDPQLKALVVGPKKYCLFNDGDDGSIIIRKASEHGLGHLDPPRGYTRKEFAEAMWTALVQCERGDRKALQRLPCARQLAVGHHPITRPEYLRIVEQAVRPRHGKPEHSLLPFGSLTVAYPVSTIFGEHPADGKHAVPVTVYTETPEDPRVRWIDLHARRPVRIWWPRREDSIPDDGAARVQTYLDVARRHLLQPEARYFGPNGRPCETFTRGELRRHPVFITDRVFLGKESHRIAEVQAGLLPTWENYQTYELDEHERAYAAFQACLPVLHMIPRQIVRHKIGLSARAVRAILNGHAWPRVAHAQHLAEIATWWQSLSDKERRKQHARARQ